MGVLVFLFKTHFPIKRSLCVYLIAEDKSKKGIFQINALCVITENSGTVIESDFE